MRIAILKFYINLSFNYQKVAFNIILKMMIPYVEEIFGWKSTNNEK